MKYGHLWGVLGNDQKMAGVGVWFQQTQYQGNISKIITTLEIVKTIGKTKKSFLFL